MQSVREFWRRKGPKTRMDAVVVYGAMAVFAGLVVFGIVLTAVTERRVIEIDIVNRSQQPIVMFRDGYHIASLGPSETRPERIYDCLDGCLVEVTDIDGHVLCAFTLNEELADSIGHEMIVSGTSPPSILCDQSSTP